MGFFSSLFGGPRPDRSTQTDRNARQTEARRTKVLRDEYMPPDVERRSLTLDTNGLPTGEIIRDRNRLVIRTAAGLVNPKSVSTYKLGIFSFTIRGTSYAGNAPKSGDFKAGAWVRLVREPDNPYDSNAVAVYAWRARNKSGFVNKANAKRLAPLLDKGVDLVAISTRGEGPGRDDYVPQILVAERRVMAHMLRRSGIGVQG